eukprot:bmy_04883T0
MWGHRCAQGIPESDSGTTDVLIQSKRGALVRPTGKRGFAVLHGAILGTGCLFAQALTYVNMVSLICNVGASGPAPSTTATPAEERKVEAKKEERNHSKI